MQHLSGAIYNWYRKNKRDLPWRQTSDPYKIWISEIILQQTRIDQGSSYYLKFTDTFPTIIDLANAPEDKVLKLWQGLGYYSRARNLHRAAKEIAEKYDGVFPSEYNNIRMLPGVGPYTAAAVASIAFQRPYPAVDGNVYRVLSRYFGIETPIDSTIGKKEFLELAETLIEGSDPGMHNQAFMEFGALQCTPKNPDCRNCPLQQSCYAVINKKVEFLPVKEKKTKQSTRYFYYYLIEQGDAIFMEKRIGNDIWKNLYQLPLTETQNALTDKQIIQQKIPALPSNTTFNVVSVSEAKKHILSHQIIWAKLIRVEISKDVTIENPFVKVNKKDISKFAVPRLLEIFLEAVDFNDKHDKY
ncbi:A/G-specific adenine glycosylase [Maribellus sediminis]|uniref:A/G-specific adenine glycosylase n=1 Tax=Maribellus sediminis TaxID=2696285 RepID=UPI001431D9DC|nr:A/G-specific adenine glycosylase [Maribellus sediminis]